MSNKGFSLIELMIVIAIIGVVSAIAYPSYTNHVAETRRQSAVACISELSQWMERYYTTKMTYEDAALPTKQCRTDLSSFYSFAFDADPSATSYKIVATALSTQASRDTKCPTISLDAQGTRSPSGCWKK